MIRRKQETESIYSAKNFQVYNNRLAQSFDSKSNVNGILIKPIFANGFAASLPDYAIQTKHGQKRVHLPEFV